MTHDERIEWQIKSLGESLKLRDWAESLVEMQEQLIYLLDTYHLWSEDGDFTFPDGNTIERAEWNRQR